VNLHLDTHVAVWLAVGDKKRLRGAAKLLSRGDLFVSPFVAVEIEVLREIGRIRQPASMVLDFLRTECDVQEATGDLAAIGRWAQTLGWTRDPFDRFIVAHALAARAVLVTADQMIREHCAQARWDDLRSEIDQTDGGLRMLSTLGSFAGRGREH
jgi:PIN domain nuclease of toxin-antitoxin system